MEEVVRYYPRVYLSEPDTPTPSVLHPSFFLQTLHLHPLHPCLPPWRRMSSSACSKVTFSVRSIRFVVIQSLGRVCLAGSKSWVEWLKMWRESCNRSRSGFWCHRVRFRHLCISFVLGASFLPTHCLLLLNAMTPVYMVCGVVYMSIPNRCHFPTWNIKALPPVAFATVPHVSPYNERVSPPDPTDWIVPHHAKQLCIWRSCGSFNPPSLFVWALLVHGMPNPTHCVCVLDRNSVFSIVQITFFFWFFATRSIWNFHSLVWVFQPTADRYPLRSSIMVPASAMLKFTVYAIFHGV